MRKAKEEQVGNKTYRKANQESSLANRKEMFEKDIFLGLDNSGAEEEFYRFFFLLQLMKL